MEEALRKTAAQKNTSYRRKQKKIRIYNLRAYRKIFIQLIASCLILISIVSVRGIDNPFTKDVTKRINECMSNSIDWTGVYKGINIWYLKAVDYTKTFFNKNEKVKTEDKVQNVQKVVPDKASSKDKASEAEQKAAVPITSSSKSTNKEIVPVFSSMNSMDIDVKYVKSKYRLAFPVKGTLSSRFGMRINPITKKEELHPGLDISAKTGAAIHSAFAGEVIESRKGTTFGNYIKIKSGKDIVSVYAHCSKLLVAKGQKVTKGQIIAKVGSTGLSSGPHTHFEVWRDGRLVDPGYLLNIYK
ncbi:MAG: M23 family metallopeptidase [Deltaproteobacteria bacterium]